MWKAFLGELRLGRWKVGLGHVGERWNCFYVHHHLACIAFTTLRLFTNIQSEMEAEFEESFPSNQRYMHKNMVYIEIV
jgi:hypothetical protein